MALDKKIGDGLKKIALAGVGAAAIAAEKSSEVIDALAQKGESSLEKGKEVSKDVKQTFEEKKAQFEESEFNEKLKSMTLTEMEAMKDTISRAQEKLRQSVQKSGDTSETAEAGDAAAEEAAAETAAEEAPAAEETPPETPAETEAPTDAAEEN